MSRLRQSKTIDGVGEAVVDSGRRREHRHRRRHRLSPSTIATRTARCHAGRFADPFWRNNVTAARGVGPISIRQSQVRDECRRRLVSSAEHIREGIDRADTIGKDAIGGRKPPRRRDRRGRADEAGSAREPGGGLS
jgi:hypothetical protein